MAGPFGGWVVVQSEDQIVARIAQLFAQELDVSPDAVGPDTHFLFTGGDSLNAESLIAAVAAEFSLRLKTAVLLDAPTPRALARLVMARLAERPPA
jgi:acyl carrier protein